MIELPKRMRTLQKDPRGYPIPFIVLRDRSGKPQFTINDQFSVRRCVNQRRCGICGKRFDVNGMWFVGGWRCFMDPHAAFIDPPSHQECAEFALKVCPFLAARSYSHRIDLKKMRPEDNPGVIVSLSEEIMPQAQPDLFGLGQTYDPGFILQDGAHDVFVVDHWTYVEPWKNGVQLDKVPDTMTFGGYAKVPT